MEKRGISPLIATVLILGFTVALAAIIMTWGTAFTRTMMGTTEETASIQILCATDVVFDIKSVCVDTTTANKFKILIENDGKESIPKWKIRYYESATKATPSPDVSTLIPSFGLGTVEFTNSTLVRKIEMIPVILKGGKDVVCSQTIDSFGDTEGEVINDEC